MQISISNAIGGGGGSQGGGSTPTPPSFADTKSFQFDGITDRFIGVGNYSELDNQTKATISFWINPTTDTSIPISIPSSGGYEQIQILLFATGEVRLRLYNNNSSQTASGAITFGVWNHILICVDLTQSTGSKCRIFIDGVNSFGNDGNSATDFSTSGGGLSLGNRTISTSFAYTGNLDEVAFFVGQDLRSASDVAEIYNGGLPNDLNTLPSISRPTTWQRMGENGTWKGSQFIMTDVNGGYVNTSVGILPTDPNPTTDVPLFDNKSFTYDGISDYFQGLSTYSELNGGTKLTLSVWLKPIAGSPKLEYVLSNPRNSTANEHQFALVLFEGNGVYFDVQSRTSQFVSGRIGAITYGAWNHILVCVDLNRTTGTEGAIFINGVDETTNSVMGTLASFYTATDALHIGVDANGGYNRFNGNIDELAIWSGSDLRSASDVSSIYNSGVPTDLNNNGLTAPTTYIRGEFATWDGSNWSVNSINGTYALNSSALGLTSRTSDVPT